MVAVESELGKLLLYDEIAEVLLVWELITEAESVIIETETDAHLAVCACLNKVDKKFIVIIADLRLLTPYGLPSLIKRILLDALHLETLIELLYWLAVLL